MNNLVFNVEFLSDIILQASSNNEGNISNLDFIPGSNFLGMAARNYNKFEDAFNVFHTSSIRFGEANILKDEKCTYKMPLSYFHEKLDEKEVYNHHHIQNFSKFTQLKQMRNSYITKDKEVINLSYSYSQKSAYDSTTRRSKDSKMFGYESLSKGTRWQFTLKYDDNISKHDLDLVKSSLLGVKRLGKSKSSQYGQVKITLAGKLENIEKDNLKDELVLYANSRIALIDNEGNATYDLKYLCSGLVDENILYAKSQIRTSLFTPYNGARQTKDYERLVINKGSVIILKNITQSQINKIKDGVGAYLNEGFGEILINPVFLEDKDEFTIKKDLKESIKRIDLSEKIEKTFVNSTMQFLVNKHNSKINRLDLDKEVSKFI